MQESSRSAGAVADKSAGGQVLGMGEPARLRKGRSWQPAQVDGTQMRNWISLMSLRGHSLSARRRSLPCDRNFQDAFYSFMQSRCRRRKREADKIFAPGAESGSGNRSDAGVFEQNLANLFGSQAGGGDVDPGIEGAFGCLTTQ